MQGFVASAKECSGLWSVQGVVHGFERAPGCQLPRPLPKRFRGYAQAPCLGGFRLCDLDWHLRALVVLRLARALQRACCHSPLGRMDKAGRSVACWRPTALAKRVKRVCVV
eukprot:s239_g24.t1